MKNLNKIVGNNIKKIRKENNLTQRQLADFLKICESSISKYEKGTTDISISKLGELSKIFNIPVVKLLEQ